MGRLSRAHKARINNLNCGTINEQVEGEGGEGEEGEVREGGEGCTESCTRRGEAEEGQDQEAKVLYWQFQKIHARYAAKRQKIVQEGKQKFITDHFKKKNCRDVSLSYSPDKEPGPDGAEIEVYIMFILKSL
ncbi:hypothetical protein BU17DRAFT_63401 [Hysterangium stoloniferum]|nr:hypothetical protein BU17DRAFT_63401 [Hysterangium stoloniferum]